MKLFEKNIRLSKVKWLYKTDGSFLTYYVENENKNKIKDLKTNTVYNIDVESNSFFEGCLACYGFSKDQTDVVENDSFEIIIDFGFSFFGNGCVRGFNIFLCENPKDRYSLLKYVYERCEDVFVNLVQLQSMGKTMLRRIKRKHNKAQKITNEDNDAKDKDKKLTDF